MKAKQLSKWWATLPLVTDRTHTSLILMAVAAIHSKDAVGAEYWRNFQDRLDLWSRTDTTRQED
jgi:hypothetical protein